MFVKCYSVTSCIIIIIIIIIIVAVVSQKPPWGVDNKFVIGRLPNLMALDLTKFLKRPKHSGTVTVTGKRVNRGAGYGSEPLCEYLICGDKFSCEWQKKTK